MPNVIVVDSGPLIALFDKDDAYHARAVEFIKGLKAELVTNNAVVTEVTHLLDFSVQTQVDFLNLGDGRWNINRGNYSSRSGLYYQIGQKIFRSAG